MADTASHKKKSCALIAGSTQKRSFCSKTSTCWATGQSWENSCYEAFLGAGLAVPERTQGEQEEL